MSDILRWRKYFLVVIIQGFLMIIIGALFKIYTIFVIGMILDIIGIVFVVVISFIKPPNIIE